jgi:hypothetical protein
MSKKIEKKGETKTLKRKLEVMEMPEDAIEPPYRCELNFKLKTFTVYVTLHKIPDKFISLHVTTDEFFLHTLDYSKKFYLKFEYEQGTSKVDPDRVETELNYGILKCTFPLIETVCNKTGTIIRKKMKKEVEPQLILPSQSTTRRASKLSTSTTATSTKPTKSTKSTKPATKQVPKSIANQQTNEKQVKVPKEAKEQTKEPKGNTRELSKDVQMSIIEELNKNEDDRAMKMTTQAESKTQHFEEKEKLKEQKKQKENALKEASLKQVKNKKEEEKILIEALKKQNPVGGQQPKQQKKGNKSAQRNAKK